MVEQNPFLYRFSTYEPVFFIEFYLPKKAKYQGLLYDTLTDGFDFEKVKKHLLAEDVEEENREEKRDKKLDQIFYLLQDYRDFKKEGMDVYTDLVKNMSTIRWGYSMYDVHGVFFDYDKQEQYEKDKRQDEKIKEQGTRDFLVEELTQTIRIIFRPDMDKVYGYTEASSREMDKTKREARSFFANAIELGKHERDEIRKTTPKNELYILDYADQWIEELGLFIFGYLIFKICFGINKKHEAKEADLQEEIWVSTVGSYLVNRIKLNMLPDPKADTVQPPNN